MARPTTHLSTYLLWTLLTAISILQLTQALRNVTVDDTDSSITWSGNWTRTLPGFTPGGSTYMTTREQSAYAEFKFTGIAVYFVSPRWPYPASTRITLDPSSSDSRPLLVPLEDYSKSTVDKDFGRPMVLARAIGLANTEHTVRVDMGTGAEAKYAVFDQFIYTALKPSEYAPSPVAPTSHAFSLVPENLISPPSSSTLSAPSSTPTKSTETGSMTGSLTRTQLIVLLVCLVVFLFIIVCLFLVWRRRKASLKKEDAPISNENVEQGEKKTNHIVSEDLTAKMQLALDEKGR